MTPARPKAPTTDFDAALELLGAAPEADPVGLVALVDPAAPVLLALPAAPVPLGVGLYNLNI